MQGGKKLSKIYCHNLKKSYWTLGLVLISLNFMPLTELYKFFLSLQGKGKNKDSNKSSSQAPHLKLPFIGISSDKENKI